MTERDFQLESYCNDLDYQLEHGKVRPEEVDKRMALLQPLESAVAEMSAPPTGPNTAAGRVAQSLWHKNHPEDADLDRLVYFLSDESAIVRLVATEAITGALETPRSKQTLSAKAKRVIRELQSRPGQCAQRSGSSA